MKKNSIILVFFTGIFLLSLPALSFGQILHIAVAADAQFVAAALKKSFEKTDRVPIEIIVGSSGKLTAQIEQGAPYDIFMSADMRYPDALYKEGNTMGSPRIYAFGKLVLWTIKRNNLNSGIQILNQPFIKTIAIANPATAPYGRAATEALKKRGIFNSVENKIVYGESTAQVNQYLLSGAADIAFTGKSVVESPALKNKGKWIEVPDDLYQPIAQGVVILKHARSDGLQAASAFYHFLFSNEGRAIFKSFGYRIK